MNSHRRPVVWALCAWLCACFPGPLPLDADRGDAQDDAADGEDADAVHGDSDTALTDSEIATTTPPDADTSGDAPIEIDVPPGCITPCLPSTDPCRANVCDEETGGCVSVAANPGGGCDDGDGCTTQDACSGGVCHGVARTCPDLDDCMKPPTCV